MTTQSNVSPMKGRLTKSLIGLDDAWDVARDCVDYPILIKELFYRHEFEEGQGKQELGAEGYTNTGRDCKYFGVVVDRDRTGDLSMIAPVTGLYDTLAPSAVYTDLMKDLEEAGVESRPRRIYVSGTGGSQILSVDITNMSNFDVSGDIRMSIQLVTSIDGSKAHHCRLVAYDEKADAELVGLKGHTFTIRARHTKTIKERHAAFSVVIKGLLEEWNTTIAPFICVMMDSKFDKATALELLNNVMDKAKIPERHINKCKEFYENNAIMSDNKEHSVYGVVASLSKYIEDNVGDKPERAELFRQDIAKRSSDLIEQAIQKI